MLSLRIVALFVVSLAGSSLAKEKTTALPLKITLGMGMCGAISISKTQILVPAMCVMGYSNMDVRVRADGITINDSGEMYRINRIVYHPDRDNMDQSKEYAILTVDRKLDGGDGFKAAKLAKDDVTIPEGDIITSVRFSTEPPTPGVSYYWYPLEYFNMKKISDAKCKELSPDKWSNDFICVGQDNPNAENTYNPCYGNQGAPLVWNGKIVAVSSYEFPNSDKVCAFRKTYTLQNFINQNIQK